MAQGGASAVVPAGEYRPSAETANWSLAAATGWAVAAIAIRDFGFLFPASMCCALWLWDAPTRSAFVEAIAGGAHS